MKLNSLNTRTEIWEYFSQNFDYKNEPIHSKELSNSIQQILTKKINNEKARGLFEILKYLEKTDDFNYDLVSQYFRKKNSDLNHAAINSLHNSKSVDAEKVLIEYIKNPKSNSAGETAVKVLHMIIQNVEMFDELIKNIDLLKKQTKNTAEYLIYVKSFDYNFLHSTEIKGYIQKKKIRSTEKWTFKNWHKSSRKEIRNKIFKKVELYSKKNYNNSASFIFYVPISKFIYTSFRVVVSFPFQNKIMIDMGIRSFWRTFYGWIDNNGTNGYFQLHEEDYHDLANSESVLSKTIDKWMYLSEKYESFLVQYDKKLVEINNPSFVMDSKESSDRGIFTELELINYALFQDDIERAKEIANNLLEFKYEKLGEYWRLFCRNIEKITVANKAYNIHAG